MAVNRLNVGATNQLLAKASSGQSTNILELQGTAGTTLAGVDASGNPVGTLAHPPTFKNLIINGAMQVSQRGTSVTGVTAPGYRTVDRWQFSPSSMGTWTMTTENDAPTGSGFGKSAKVLCTTADASPAAGDYLTFEQKFEGQNLQQIAKGTSSAKQLTASFWVKSNVTGTYILELNDNSRTVNKSYTISASATWEYKTIVFPADTTGTITNDNALRFVLNFWLGAGTNFTSGTLNSSAWASTVNANRAVGQTNVASATNNYWQITGVQLEVGSVATDYEFKPFDVELAQCQRYYYKISDTSSDNAIFGLGHASSTTNHETYIQLNPTMRIKPTSIESNSLWVQTFGGGTVYTVTACTFESSVSSSFLITVKSTVASGLTAGTVYRLLANGTTGYIAMNAEL